MEIKGTNFESVYLELLNIVIRDGKRIKTRGGETIELLNVKTTIKEPMSICVGGKERDMNIFFLLMEAMWIFLGRNDVEPLTIFNSNMKHFSDDGETFHAPYGYRLRNYGVPSSYETYSKLCSEQKRQCICLNQSFDQIEKSIKMLSTDENDRRVVMSIWNPFLDLDFQCKDIPCNDMIMLKIRNKELHMTIQNRSNDLHWGLPTNYFQFSFLGQIISKCLGVKYGTQTHNSQSLHVYMDNPITLRMLNSKSENFVYTSPTKMYDIFSDFEITDKKNPIEMFDELHFYFNEIFQAVLHFYKTNKNSGEEWVKDNLIYKLLRNFITYKTEPKKNDEVKLKYAYLVLNESSEIGVIYDIQKLAASYFLNKVFDKSIIDKELLKFIL